MQSNRFERLASTLIDSMHFVVQTHEGLHFRLQATHPGAAVATFRSFFPESVWKQIDCLFPRGSQPVAYDIAIGTGRGAIELAKRQVNMHQQTLLLCNTWILPLCSY